MSGLVTLLAGWRKAPPPDLTRRADRAEVRLLDAPARTPRTQTERALVDTLAGKGRLSRPVLVSLAALALYRHEISHGGRLVDLGMFGDRLFVRDVTRALEAGRGVLWDIEIPGGCRR